MIKFDGNTIIERNEAELITTQLGDDIVLMNTNNGDYVGMNAVGTDIWNLLKTPLSVDGIIINILDIYEIDEQHGKKSLTSFIELMLERKVLVISAN